MAEPLTVAEAQRLAIRAHGDQRDRDGSLHDHVARVVVGVGSSDASRRVAWLHDVLEDCDVDRGELRARLPDDEWRALCLLTRDGDEGYADYVAAIARAEGRAGQLARTVKESDLLDNLRRCGEARDPAIGRYGAALATLWAHEG